MDIFSFASTSLKMQNIQLVQGRCRFQITLVAVFLLFGTCIEHYSSKPKKNSQAY